MFQSLYSGFGLLGFFVESMLFAMLAIFHQFQSFLQNLLIFVGKMSNGLAFGAFKFDQIILGHIFAIMLFN
jgi:hypothetical protein